MEHTDWTIWSFQKIWYYDIETIPCVKNYEDLPKAMQECREKSYCKKKPEDVSYADYFFDRAPLTPEFAQIVAVSFWVFQLQKNRKVIKNIYGTDEQALLEACASVISKVQDNWWVLCWYNINRFDNGFLFKRMMFRNIVVNHSMKMGNVAWKINKNNVWFDLYDLAEPAKMWFNQPSFRLLCLSLWLWDPKAWMDWSHVWAAYWNPTLHTMDDIATYCQWDVFYNMRVDREFKRRSWYIDADLKYEDVDLHVVNAPCMVEWQDPNLPKPHLDYIFNPDVQSAKWSDNETNKEADEQVTQWTSSETVTNDNNKWAIDNENVTLPRWKNEVSKQTKVVSNNTWSQDQWGNISSDVDTDITRPEIIQKLQAAGIEYKKWARTTTLIKLRKEKCWDTTKPAEHNASGWDKEKDQTEQQTAEPSDSEPTESTPVNVGKLDDVANMWDEIKILVQKELPSRSEDYDAHFYYATKNDMLYKKTALNTFVLLWTCKYVRDKMENQDDRVSSVDQIMTVILDTYA